MRRWIKPSHKTNWLKGERFRTHMSIFLVFTNSVYPSLSRSLMSGLRCEKVGGLRVMKYDTSIICDFADPAWTRYFIVTLTLL